jgi:hypothetical protein
MQDGYELERLREALHRSSRHAVRARWEITRWAVTRFRRVLDFFGKRLSGGLRSLGVAKIQSGGQRGTNTVVYGGLVAGSRRRCGSFGAAPRTRPAGARNAQGSGLDGWRRSSAWGT